MADPTTWRKIVDSTKDHIVTGPSDVASVNRRIRDLRRGAPVGLGKLAIAEALYELGLESRATA
ncbi:hypothetical protein [Smaragdicoccus niigatensis]|uniref:hypothetical protein n=1 Tax=Smaragdicoccus niigatensis TaxID=359359 RepID=UPI00036CDAFB|nr:hypothetical protein [Smaragdicoccus niigatensis]